MTKPQTKPAFSLLHRKYVLLGIVFSALVCSAIYLKFYKNINPINAEKSNRPLLAIMQKLEQIWIAPDIARYRRSNDFECKELGIKELKNADASDLACRHEFFNCALKYEFLNNRWFQKTNLEFLAPIVEKPYFYYEGEDQRQILRARSVVVLRDKTSKEKFQIELLDNCDQATLPKGKYLVGHKDSRVNSEYLLDVNQDVIANRSLIKKRELKRWLKVFPEYQIPKVKAEEDNFPASGLSPDQMQQFCRYYGGSVMPSEYFDAFTFLPKELNGVHKNEFKAPYIYSYFSKVDQVFPEKSCDKIHFKGCPKEGFKNSTEFSWAGLRQVHGGVMEYMPAIFRNPSFGNIWASSSSFEINSRFHQLGQRVTWDGTAPLKKYIHLLESDEKEWQDITEQLEIGFRCLWIK